MATSTVLAPLPADFDDLWTCAGCEQMFENEGEMECHEAVLFPRSVKPIVFGPFCSKCVDHGEMEGGRCSCGKELWDN